MRRPHGGAVFVQFAPQEQTRWLTLRKSPLESVAASAAAVVAVAAAEPVAVAVAAAARSPRSGCP